MKQDIHPEYNPVCFEDVSTGKRFLTKSSMKFKKGHKTIDVDGVEYFQVICDITADSHPAYTGEKRFVDTAGRVEKFQSRSRRKR